MKFLVKQYEIHVQTYSVDAEDKADAIFEVINCRGNIVRDSREYVEVDESIGMPVDGNEGIADILESLGIVVPESHIPSIHSVEEIQ